MIIKHPWRCPSPRKLASFILIKQLLVTLLKLTQNRLQLTAFATAAYILLTLTTVHHVKASTQYTRNRTRRVTAGCQRMIMLTSDLGELTIVMCSLEGGP